jgi:LPXTG-site transpeptidase (sortase) family protein
MDMLEIVTKKRRWPQITLICILLVFLISGCYILLTIFSPTIPVLSGRQLDETKKKLEKPAGTFGDRLYIPKINIDVEIIGGNESSALEKGAWHRRPENGDPIKGGNFVLSAHRFVMSYTPQGTAVKSPFYNIGQLQVGDKLYVDFKGKRYEYEIFGKYGVKPDNVEVESPTNDPQLTLYSCTLQGSSDGRDVIEARPTNKPGE